MIHKILSITFAFALLIGSPITMQASEGFEAIENEFQNVSISVSESVLHISGANGQVLQIYNVAGVCLMRVKIDSQDKRYELNYPKGCYIIKAVSYTHLRAHETSLHLVCRLLLEKKKKKKK